MTHKHFVVLASLCALACACSPKANTPKTKTQATTTPVEVSVFAINDLHGHLEGPTGSVRVKGQKVKAGGVDTLATHINRLRKEHKHSAFVCAGDLVGASPLLSALFHDEPTVEAMNLLQMDLLAVGNHEFDDGVDELLRLKNGGCHPEEGCREGKKYEGAKFPFLAANVIVKETNKPLFPPYLIKSYDGVKVGFIGLTFENTPSAVSPSAVAKVKFLNEVETINRYTKELKEKGVRAIVVVIHEGATPTGLKDLNECPNIKGPIVDIAKKIDDEVDVIVAGHTHQVFNCTIDNKIVTSAKSYGRVLTHVKMSIDRKSGQVIKKSAVNVANTRDVKGEVPIVQHIDGYKKIVAPLANKRVGMQTADLSRNVNAAGESVLGNIIADAQLEETSGLKKGNAQIALMNPGGVRGSLKFEPSGEEAKGEITYAEVQRIQPFGNTLVTMSLTGAQIEQILEAQFRDGRDYVLQPSNGFTYTWQASKPIGDRVDPKTIKLNGKVLDPKATYRVTVNSFLASGGDGFKTFKAGKDIVGGRVDLDVLVDYFKKYSPIKPSARGRITKLP